MASMFSTQDFVEKITKITPGNTKPEQIKQVRGEKMMLSPKGILYYSLVGQYHL